MMQQPTPYTRGSGAIIRRRDRVCSNYQIGSITVVLSGDPSRRASERRSSLMETDIRESTQTVGSTVRVSTRGSMGLTIKASLRRVCVMGRALGDQPPFKQILILDNTKRTKRMGTVGTNGRMDVFTKANSSMTSSTFLHIQAWPWSHHIPRR